MFIKHVRVIYLCTVDQTFSQEVFTKYLLTTLRIKINIHRRLHAYKLGAYFFVNKNIKSVKFVVDKCLMIEELVSLWLKSGVPETTTGVLAV